jgi:hypothetical protein
VGGSARQLYRICGAGGAGLAAKRAPHLRRGDALALEQAPVQVVTVDSVVAVSPASDARSPLAPRCTGRFVRAGRAPSAGPAPGVSLLRTMAAAAGRGAAAGGLRRAAMKVWGGHAVALPCCNQTAAAPEAAASEGYAGASRLLEVAQQSPLPS